MALGALLLEKYIIMDSKVVKLTDKFYYGSDPILTAVDNIIFGFDAKEEKLKILLFKRLVEPFSGQWSLIGSFIRPDENADTSAHRILKELTGISKVFLEQLKCYTNIDRDPGARVISIAYYSLIRLDDHDKDLVKSYDAEWFDIDDIPDLVLDHNEMVNDALVQLRILSRRKPIGFELLPKQFTLPKLIKLYQEIYQHPLDDRNFRKKILGFGLLNKLDKKDKSTSKKGAFLYKFDREKYMELLDKGINFEL